MDRVIDEMAKAKGDIEKRYREKIPEIIQECMAFAYLGKTFTFDANSDLENRVNQRLIELSDEILEDIEKRAKRAIQYAEEEDDEDAILAYMKREQNGEDLISRIDKHNSNLRYFLEGWMAIGFVNNFSQTNLLTNILTYIGNPYASPLWQKAFREGYLANSIRTQGYSYGRGNMKNPIDALTLLEQDSINSAFQYGTFLRYGKEGAIGYTIHRGSGFDCPYCDSFTGIVHPMTECLLPLHPRCACWSKPVYDVPNSTTSIEILTNKVAAYRAIQAKKIANPLKGIAFADITGGIVPALSEGFTALLNRFYKTKANRDRVAILKDIISDKSFKKLSYHSTKRGSIFSTNRDFDVKLSEKEMPKNLRIARKYAKNGYDVYLLPNPNSSKSADFVTIKDGKLYYTEGKTLDGKNSLDHLFEKGAKQSDRVTVDIVGTNDTQYIFKEILGAFNNYSNLNEIHLFKGSRLITIKRSYTTDEKKFRIRFKEMWEQNK